MADTLEERPAFQAITEGGQCKCLHCFKRAGFFDWAEGKTPIMMYARPCQEHQFFHPTAFDVGQWCLEQVGLERTYIHNPLGGLAVLWVDMALIGQIDVQLLRQDNKEDRAAGIDSYAFCNKVGDLTRQHPHLKSKAVVAHVHVAMAMKWEPYKWVVDYRRRGITDLSRGPRIIAVPVSSTSHITLNLVDRVSADEPPITHHRLGGSITPITRSDSCFVGGWDVGYVNEGIHAIEEEQPGVLSTVFSDHEPESEATSDGLAERPMKDAEDGGVGYVLEPPPGIDAGGVIGDPAAVNMSGSVKVRNGEEGYGYGGGASRWGLQRYREALRALTDRHFKFDAEIGTVSEKGKRALQLAVSSAKLALMRSALDRGVVDEIHERMLAAPEKYKSNKRTSEAFRAALTSAGLEQGVPLRKSGHVKPNEALGKQKPRIILEGGPRSVVTHLFDAGVMEDLIFNTPFFESRSIKHTDMKGLCQRMREMAERFEFTASLDFGAFDSSLGADIRNEVEKSLLHSVVGHLMHACQFTRDALNAPDNENLKAVIQREARLLVEEKIRESGDRGTSILNYLTNMIAFLEAFILLARERGVADKAIKRIISDFFKGEGDWLDIMAEGDDGEQFFSKALLSLLGYRNGDKVDTAKFGEDFFACYKHLGLRIEPQGPKGEIPFSKALVSTAGRMEFCSKLFIYHKGTGAWMPKPKKTFVGSQVSFDVAHDIHAAGMVKALALMNNCQCCEVMLKYFAAMFRYHKSAARVGALDEAKKLQDGGAWNYYSMANEHLVSKNIDSQCDALVSAHESFRMQDVSGAVDNAFCQETGMGKQAQRSWCLSLDSCDGDRSKRMMASFLDAIKC
ncbi:unnamed protein product [Symbiodinium sp. KB8]|nr:unnamed protein product [Symbiodinium sp. KB8]